MIKKFGIFLLNLLVKKMGKNTFYKMEIKLKKLISEIKEQIYDKSIKYQKYKLIYKKNKKLKNNNKIKYQDNIYL